MEKKIGYAGDRTQVAGTFKEGFSTTNQNPVCYHYTTQPGVRHLREKY